MSKYPKRSRKYSSANPSRLRHDRCKKRPNSSVGAIRFKPNPKHRNDISGYRGNRFTPLETPKVRKQKRILTGIDAMEIRKYTPIADESISTIPINSVNRNICKRGNYIRGTKLTNQR